MKEIIIDLGAARNKNLNESFLSILGYFTEIALKRMFGYDFAIPIKVKGSPAEISSFMGALKREKSYLEAYKKHGLTDPKTLNNKHLLNKAVSNFEKVTGLKWPFK
tara:strand:+ start:402 stop:719 length:318 start_codon:yes stop_codon:yes gene_type:complete